MHLVQKSKNQINRRQIRKINGLDQGSHISNRRVSLMKQSQPHEGKSARTGVRTYVIGTTFVSIPSAVVGVDDDLKNVIKMEFTPLFTEKAKNPLKLETYFSADKLHDNQVVRDTSNRRFYNSGDPRKNSRFAKTGTGELEPDDEIVRWAQNNNARIVDYREYIPKTDERSVSSEELRAKKR